MTRPRPAARLLLLAPLAAVPHLRAMQAPESVDETYARARRLTTEGQREAARQACLDALRRSPDYHDIRILLGRLDTWDRRYDEGRAAFRYVLDRRPDYLDAREALIDLETWSGHPREALRVCEEGLALSPGNTTLWFRKARLLKAAGDPAAALAAAQRAVAADPGNAPARALLQDLVELNQRDKLALSYTYDHFDRTFDPWRTVTVAATHRFDLGSAILRVNHATRFGETGDQVEVDAYPHLAEGTYAYLNAGYSGDAIFPRTRSGAELYHNFPRGIEASLGLRHLQFPGSGVTIYTGSLGKYWGSYLVTLRLNTTPGSAGNSNSGSLAVRRYFAEAEDYLTVTAGTGVSPDQPSATLERLNLRSRTLGFSGQMRAGRRFLLLASLAYERQEVSATAERAQTTASAGFEWKF